MNDIICVVCGKNFPFYQNKGRPVPRFCSHKCRLAQGGTGFIDNPKLKISDMTEEQKFERLKKSFEKHVIRQEGCWDWKGPIDRGGYPVMSCQRKIGSDRGHRASWIIHKGPIPQGMHICHSCDCPICTNPDHLWLGTYKQNNEDKIIKGRQANNIPPLKKGSQNGAAKLNEKQVEEINALLKKGLTSRAIGAQYGVSKTTILRIKNGKNWNHIKEVACTNP